MPITGHQSTPTPHTVCDTVITHLAADEYELRARVAELERDVIVYRALLFEALVVAHDLTTERDALRAAIAAPEAA